MINDYENQLLMGWDIHQWAVAIDRIGLGGTQMKYADRCHRDYINKFGQDPLEFQLIGVEMGGNIDLAAALFEQLEHGLEKAEGDVKLDSSYGDHGKDDYDYDEGRRNIWTRGV